MNKIQKLKSAWDKEYAEKNFMTGTKPQSSFLKFIKFTKKEWGLRGKNLAFEGLKAIDLGAGEAKNAAYLAERGAKVIAIDISSVALEKAKKLYANLDIDFINKDILTAIKKLDSCSIDLALDIMSSHFLSNKEREVYLSELKRVLKPGSFVFIRSFLLDGDKNVKELIKKYPGTEKGYYFLPELQVEEKVFTLQEFIDLFSQHFKIIKIDTEEHYSKFRNKNYKRKYITAILQKS